MGLARHDVDELDLLAEPAVEFSQRLN